MANATISNPAINLEIIKPFMFAVKEVFQKMAGVEVTIERPFVKAGPGATHDVCGIIGFTGNITGNVTVSFSDAAAIKLVECFAGELLARDHPDFADAVGELANMIAGSAKKNLGAAANISVPSVVIGRGYTIAGMSNMPSLVIPCKTVHGEFAVEVCIKQKAA